MKKILGFTFAVTLFCAPAFAQTFEAIGTVTGGAVDAKATFVSSANTVDIMLENLIFNQHNESVGQNLSGIFFNLSNGAMFGVGDTLSSSSGASLNVASDGSYTTGPAGGVSPTNWGFAGGGSVGAFTLNDLGPVGGGPTETIIGPSNDGTYLTGNYSNANSSIKGNGPHNPFLESGATFDLTIPGLTANDFVTSVTFQFGTTFADQLVVGTTVVPEPSTWICGALAALMLVLQITRAHSFSKRASAKKPSGDHTADGRVFPLS